MMGDISDMLSTAQQYFEYLITTKGEGDELKHVLSSVAYCVIEEANEGLIVEYTAEKVMSSLKTMAPTKALGIDGFPAKFFQKYQHIIGEEVTKFFLEVLNDNKSLEVINVTQS